MKNTVYTLLILLTFILTACNKEESPTSAQPSEGKWEVISNTEIKNNAVKIYFADSQNGWVIGDSGYVAATNNGGISWTRQETGSKRNLYSIYFTDSRNGLVGGNDRYLLKTADGGLTWQKIAFNNDTTNSVTFIKSTGGNLWLGSGKKIYSSNDNGNTWQFMYNISGFSADNFYAFGNTSYTGRWISRTFGRSTDGGQSWKEVQLPFYFLNNIYFINDKTGWATEDNSPSSITDTSSVYMTTDGGDSWKKVFSIEAVQTDNIYFTDRNHGWFSCWIVRNAFHGASSRIYNTSDGGKTFNIQYISNDDDFIWDIFYLSDKAAWALTYGGKVIRYSK